MQLMPWLQCKFFTTDGSNLPLAGGLVTTYLTGTGTKANTYQNNNGVANSNPVVLDPNGEAQIWFDPAIVYDIIVTDRDGGPVLTRQEVSTQSGGTTPVIGSYIKTTSADSQPVETDIMSESSTAHYNQKGYVIVREGMAKVRNDVVTEDPSFALPSGQEANINKVSGSANYSETLYSASNNDVKHSEILSTSDGLTGHSVSLIQELSNDGVSYVMYDSLHGKVDRYARLSDTSASFISSIDDTDDILLNVNSGELTAYLAGSAAWSAAGIVTYGGTTLVSGNQLNVGSIVVCVPEPTLTPYKFKNKYRQSAGTVITAPVWGASNVAQVVWNSFTAAFEVVVGGLDPTQISYNYYQICIITTNDGINITGYSPNVRYCINPAATLRQFLNFTGSPKQGLGISGRANLGLNVADGAFFGMGINPGASAYGYGDLLNITEHAAITNGTLGITTVSRNAVIVPSTTVINPNQYDLNGVMTAVPVNNWQNIRVYGAYEATGSGNTNGLIVLVQYGQTTYANATTARAGIATESFVAYPDTSKMVLLSYVTIQRGATASSTATYTNTGIWAGSVGSAGGASITGTNLTTVRINGSGSAVADTTSYMVTTLAELITALEATATRAINVVAPVTVSSANVVNINSANPITLRGAPITFTGSTAALNLTAGASLSIYNDIFVTGTTTATPLGVSASTSIRIRQVLASTNLALTLPSGSVYEKLSLGTGSVSGGLFSFWDNTAANNVAAPLLQVYDTYDLSLSQGTPSLAGGLIMSRLKLPAGGIFSKLLMFASTTLGTAIPAGVYTHNPSTNLATRIATATIPTGAGFLSGTLNTSVTLNAGTEFWLAVCPSFAGISAFETITPNSSLYNGNTALYYSNSADTTLPATKSITAASFAALSMPWISIQA